MRSILVTRPQPAADEFAEKLRREGYTAYVAPMMEYAAIAAELGDLAEYQALIFTSAQAIQVFCSLSSERNKPVLAVGDATATAAGKVGFINVRSARGNSQDVAALIKEEAAALHLRKALHPCGADTADDIAAAVATAGVEVIPRTVYKAVLVNSIPDDVAAALQRGAIDTVMLFSTRTAENFVRLMIARGLRNICPRLEVICISDAVASALRELPWRSIRVARQPRLDAVMQALQDQAKAQERRQRIERRRKAASLDDHGHVDSEAYAGPERRTNARRRHDATQRKRIWREKKKILNRSMLTVAFMFIAIVLAGVFLMAPEYAHIEAHPVVATRPEGGKSTDNPGAAGAALNKFISWFQRTANPVADAVSGAASSAADMAVNPGSADFVQVLSNLAAARQQGGGNAAVAQALDHLRSLLSNPDVRTPEDVNRAVGQARDDNKTLDGLFGSVKGNDVGAAAMLLALNEFRGNVGGNRPYAEDLALLKKLSGNDPRMNRALQRLAPYAESGVMNRQALQAELKGLAGDIITAKVQGRDVSIQSAANKRLERLERAGKVGARGTVSSDALVARAQMLLDKGDVKGAMRELGKLEGASAEAARPWMNNATNHVMADQSSEELTQSVLQAMGAGGGSLDDIVNMIKQTLDGASVPYISPSLIKRGSGSNDGIVAPAATAVPLP